jgi:hypothetical protein
MSASSQTSASYPIDIIVPWVDGNDPVWQAQRAAYQQGSTNAPASDATAAYRFRDWDLMRYWFRAIDAFAPWVRRVFFVTCGQTPQWLDTSNPRLVCVDHRDYIPEEYLPTFDSNVIELFYNRIPDLAEHFVLFNDDMFLVAPTLANDFFKDGLPKDDAILGIIYTADSYDVFEHTMLSNSAVINRHFQLPEVYRAHKGNHIPTPFLKSSFDELWEAEPDVLYETATHRFRTPYDVTQHLVQAWQFCKGEFVPRGGTFGRNFALGPESDAAVAAITSGQYKAICLNDTAVEDDFERDQQRIEAAFQQLLPEPCSFELR